MLAKKTTFDFLSQVDEPLLESQKVGKSPMTEALTDTHRQKIRRFALISGLVFLAYELGGIVVSADIK